MLYKDIKWTMWEYIEYDQQKSRTTNEADYNKLLRKVAWFDNMVQFHSVWNKIPHAQLSNILYDGDSNQFKV